MKISAHLTPYDDCVSVESREPDSYGKVVSNESKVCLRNVDFVVQPAGRERVRETGTKNVHAFVRGEWDGSVQVTYGDYVTYDPFEHDHFFSPDVDAYVDSADKAIVTTKGVFAEDLTPLPENS